ncbi:AAA family ATPase [Gordonia rhizosphera]|uniref:Nuclease SbcCD subunit C n=1 Tax=Gordonia rhizosphera NBRC 16068 TaxID=1108045 RepID=K6W8D3_9ACTN|nr:SMC family ATPase [Gordonia rhizosphera]GAB90011.1 nuclease SbcCD subunit C [Gordonia rhizosphera NBRC 16068]
MRLHSLRMRAFGPFAGEAEIDFDALAGDGLFLLHGQTGAGKTTVLDGVAFALFGRVPGARDTNRRLHSDHAPAEEVPEVELEATIGGRRLRITRSPEHQRPKKRGTGTTKVQACATLVWVDGSGVDLTRLPEIGEAITGLLGMSAEQFFQVVLLPQGEFARFLRATSEEREGLLERLFDTARFGDVEDWLRNQARVSATVLDDKVAAVDRIAGQITALGGDETADPDMAWAQGCVDSARARAERSSADLAAAQTALDRAQAAHDRGRTLAERRRRGTEAQARLDQLDGGQEKLAATAAALESARRAAPLAPIAEDCDRASAALEKAAAARAQAESELGELPDAVAMCLSDDDEILREAAERWAAESGRLEPLAARVADRPTLVAAVTQIQREVEDADRRLGELDSRLAAAPVRRAGAVDELNRAVDARSQIPRLQSEHDRLSTLAKALRDRDALTPQLVRAGQELRRSDEKHLAAREHLLDVRERRLAGMAAELASKLVAGQPCAVCGSVEHPLPAVGDSATRVEKADEDTAAHTAGAAADDRTRASAQLAALTERRDQLDSVVGDAGSGQVDTDRARNASELADAERRADRVAELERAVKVVDGEVEGWRSERAGTEVVQAARRERLGAARAAVDSLDAEVAEATAGRIDVAGRRAELADLCRRTALVRAARTELAGARHRAAEAVERFAEQCAAAGFGDVAAARAAAATSEAMASWESVLQQAVTTRAAAVETLAAEDVRAAMAVEPVDVDELAANVAAAQEVRDRTAGEHAVAARRLGDLEKYVPEFWSALEAVEPVRARHEELHGLVELVAGRGQNARRMSLHSYVLAARLQEVLIAASVRLRQMSSGRYEFVHSDAVGPRGRRGGLGIDIRDEYTGTLRAATTLSGGETFFASLALALGLADVVSAESGGHVLDTIFIDEGFGTLDPETLDLVMGVLDELRSGGRVVGVVSHVDELRARIPAQLHVQRGEDGSRVRLLGALGVS